MLDQDIWKSVYVDYHEPFVERLWTQIEDKRVYLHRILPATKVHYGELFHPHAWPSAMKILSGGYAMNIGFSEDQYIPTVSASFILPAGSIYDMSRPEVWHAVMPSIEPSLSLMVTGTPWKRWAPKPSKILRELTDAECSSLIYDVKLAMGLVL